MLIKNKKSCKKCKIMSKIMKFWLKTQQNMAFWQNHGI